MEAKELKISDILTESKKYVIPPYQRAYSWTKDNANQLISDLYASYQNDDKEYFVGSMICINQGGNLFEVKILKVFIITTMSILSESL